MSTLPPAGAVLPPLSSALAASAPAWLREALELPYERLSVPFAGVELRAYAWGDPELPGLVLAHGFQAHALCLAHVAALLSDRYRVVVYDQAGMGDSPLPDDFESSRRGEELLAVVDATGLGDGRERPFVITHSQGGHCAMSAIESAPDLFRGFVLVDMMMLAPDAVAERMQRRGARRWPLEPRPHLASPTRAELRERFRLQPPQPCDNQELLDFVAHHSMRETDKGFVWKFDPRVLVTDGQQVDWWARQPQRFADLRIRRAVVHGEGSAVFPPASASLIRELSQGTVPIVGVPEAHHHLMLDQPLALVAVLRAFLEAWASERGDGG